ncbi:MAG TPA: SAM-dependent methyltransferase [Trebonia sp.]|nr:SAM-dependent methyltransferase [Trebonia sp.]
MADEWLRETTRPVKRARIDTSVPNVARVWNYLVGGRDNFEADRKAVRQLIATAPVMEHVGVASRAFLRRSVNYLAGEAGIRQFLDIGTGIPAAGNTHEVAQEIAPESKIVYVDNDPVVLSHARAMLRSAPGGVTSYVDADARNPARIIEDARGTLSLEEPVAVILIDILNFISDGDEVRSVLSVLMDALVSGSYVVIMQPASDIDQELRAAERRWNQLADTPVVLRDRAEVTTWFEGLDLVEPGIVTVTEWRPGPGDPVFSMPMPLYGAVALKP